MNAAITVTPLLVGDLLAADERMPIYVHLIEHPDGLVLVDSGLTGHHPLVADLDPRIHPLDQHDLDLDSIDIVVNTHLHFDHCGGNHLFPGRPIYVQRRELDDARTLDDYTIREWVDPPGISYVPVDGAVELLPGLRLVPAPGHTAGLQMVVVETCGRRVVIGGDVAVWFGELDQPDTEGQRRVHSLNPEMVWLTHEHQPWRPAAQGAPRSNPSPAISPECPDRSLSDDFEEPTRRHNLIESFTDALVAPGELVDARALAAPAATPTTTRDHILDNH